MSAHSEKYPRWAAAVPVCREALKRGFLTFDRGNWSFGRRRFRQSTVNSLIDNGEAVRIGQHVVAWRAA